MWRSIILSTFDKTYLPYYSYIRYLNLEDLLDLLRDPGFNGKVKDEFFTPELHDFVFRDYELKGNKRLRSSRNLPDNSWIMVKIGSAIVERTRSIHGLSCSVPSSSLSEWLEEMPLLQTLNVWSGDSLTQHSGDKIRNHCPEFKRLTIFRWANEPPRNAEDDSEVFLNELHPHTLEYFEVLSYSQLGPRSIKALGSQLGSLVELKLTSLGIDAIAELPSLEAPPALKVLVLTDSVPVTRDERFYSIIEKVAQWIRSCKSLRHLELRRFVDDPALLAQTFTGDELRLTSLSLLGYTMAGSRAFHEALGSHQSLQTLCLHGEGQENPEDNEVLASALTQLINLRELQLKDISDCFPPGYVMSITPFLKHLEKLWISGEFFDDSIWQAFLCLPKLQSLVIHALSEFTTLGVLSFISELGPGNRGLNLSILSSTSTTDITEESQTTIRDALKKIDGSFDFGLVYEEYSDADSEEMSD
ncbi:hypothetical protein MW887_000309 [Aspergillus wentii]|nr:hypothetical protein MW887_000309 [Aspergillus wentii]